MDPHPGKPPGEPNPELGCVTSHLPASNRSGWLLVKLQAITASPATPSPSHCQSCHWAAASLGYGQFRPLPIQTCWSTKSPLQGPRQVHATASLIWPAASAYHRVHCVLCTAPSLVLCLVRAAGGRLCAICLPVLKTLSSASCLLKATVRL